MERTNPDVVVPESRLSGRIVDLPIVPAFTTDEPAGKMQDVLGKLRPKKNRFKAAALDVGATYHDDR